MSSGASSTSTSSASNTASSCAVSRDEPFLAAPIAQFGCHDDASANVLFSNFGNTISNPAARVSHQVRYNIGVEQESHRQKSAGSAGRSSIGGNSSSRVD